MVSTFSMGWDFDNFTTREVNYIVNLNFQPAVLFKSLKGSAGAENIFISAICSLEL